MNTSSQLPTSETPNYFNFCETLQIPEARSSFQTRSLLSFASLTNGQSRETDPPQMLLFRGEHGKKSAFKRLSQKQRAKTKHGGPGNRTQVKKACEAHQPDMVP